MSRSVRNVRSKIALHHASPDGSCCIGGWLPEKRKERKFTPAMPTGKIIKIVHLSLQSGFSTESSPQPKGYGYLSAEGGDREIYFPAKAVKGYGFDDLQAGQMVEFEPDAQAPVAKSVTLSGAVLDAPSPQIESS